MGRTKGSRGRSTQAERDKAVALAAGGVGSPAGNEALVASILADNLAAMTERDIEKAAEAVAPLVRRPPSVVAGWIGAARERLQQRAPLYADAHFAALQGALSDGEWATAGRLAEFGIERITDKTDTGRVVESPKTDAPTQATQVIVNAQIGWPKP